MYQDHHAQGLMGDIPFKVVGRRFPDKPGSMPTGVAARSALVLRTGRGRPVSRAWPGTQGGRPGARSGCSRTSSPWIGAARNGLRGQHCDAKWRCALDVLIEHQNTALRECGGTCCAAQAPGAGAALTILSRLPAVAPFLRQAGPRQLHRRRLASATGRGLREQTVRRLDSHTHAGVLPEPAGLPR